MGQQPPYETFTGPVCRGSVALGSDCGHCEKCEWEKAQGVIRIIPDPPKHPPGEYAIVELFGHTTLVGRFAEVDRFGTKMLALEPIFAGELLDPVFHGGAALYRLTPCSAEVAFARAPTQGYELPASIRAVVPQTLLPAPPSNHAEHYDPTRDPFPEDDC